MRVRSGDTEIFYEVSGNGPDLVLLHPFPASHHVWGGVAELLSTRYRVITPDLRGLGDSPIGDRPATMQQHAEDLLAVLQDVGVVKASFAGNSIGGYILFEFWRRFRERVEALVFVDTKASADGDDARKTRLQAAEDVLKRGTEPFIEAQLPKLIGESTHRNRPDVVQNAKRWMMQASAMGIAAVQRGMAERADSVPTLSTINVPTLILWGEEDTATPLAEMEKIHSGIRNSRLRRIPKAGHYAPLEAPEQVHLALREFLGR
ncbi:MAG TPA: alpha/beta fold hydrolase [Terriglobales bacterium]|nr:alpha/beta fold hydrolase [Terriglobales bacterium]